VDELRNRIAADLVSDPSVRALITEAFCLAGDDRAATLGLIVLRLRQGRPADDGVRAAISRAGRTLERSRLGG